ncbi:MAG: hypothetical protein COU85_00315 [Candidatus Portnoybacteria bacterium CG10_big_fil_rev_8_21_14_0_10_44_7]|uniref:Glycosyl transferase family 1 domain-containing protein n=1 Tax=Candidatus Portnoybacteria bacterium CG10_big_fil_rev_8_21_14_0_10_44_7 TaxID=1974816 RepID=A0A2M8KJG4_9BACT|nr:MAG: hypothetical protein COU85_00315 [Candidatus Portnoybacteria bacterium CG10_big_fil_rev_8_21_14_0_10_44_7]
MSKEIYLYTAGLFWSEKAKSVLKRLLNRQLRGPRAVQDSLFEGLRELDRSFLLNFKLRHFVDSVGVLSNARTLAWVLQQKSKGLIGKVIAGPNLVVTPKDEGGVLESPLIDKIIVPSRWVKDYYEKISPGLENKIFIWPAGVLAPSQNRANKVYDFFIYNKLRENELPEKIMEELRAGGFKVGNIEYGKFKQADYFKILEQSKFLIYLSKSESQGLAMFEAWARNVPTLIWDRGFFEKAGVKITGFAASPFLDPSAGMRFKDFQEFKDILSEFMQTNFEPRQYVLLNFSHKICAQKYLDIVNA